MQHNFLFYPAKRAESKIKVEQLLKVSTKQECVTALCCLWFYSVKDLDVPLVASHTFSSDVISCKTFALVCDVISFFIYFPFP